MESRIDRIGSPAALPPIHERREPRQERDQRSGRFRRALGDGDETAAPEPAPQHDPNASTDAGVPLDDEPGRNVDFAA